MSRDHTRFTISQVAADYYGIVYLSARTEMNSGNKILHLLPETRFRNILHHLKQPLKVTQGHQKQMICDFKLAFYHNQVSFLYNLLNITICVFILVTQDHEQHQLNGDSAAFTHTTNSHCRRQSRLQCRCTNFMDQSAC